MSKVNIIKPFVNLDGSPILLNDKPQTFKDIAIFALLTDIPQPDGRPENITPIQKVKNATIATQMYSCESEMELSVEDKAMLKDRIGKVATALIVMQSFEILEA